MGGVYSADGQIVVREGRGHHHGYTINPKQHHHHHHLHHHQHRHNHDKRAQKGHEGRRWPEECGGELHWRGGGGGGGGGSETQRRRGAPPAAIPSELIPRARLRQRSPDYSRWEDPVRPLRHTVSFCGKLGPQYQQHQQTRQAAGRERRVHQEERSCGGGGETKRGFCTLRRNSERQRPGTVAAAGRMERSDDSNESGYDGGSQENILEEEGHRYETVGKKKEQLRQELEERRIDRGEEGPRREEETNTFVTKVDKVEDAQKENKKENHKSQQDDTKQINGEKKSSVKYYSRDNTEDSAEDDCSFESKKLTIHAVIETVHKKHVEEINEASDEEDDHYEKIDDFRNSKESFKESEIDYEKELDDSLEPTREVVYSHVKMNKTVKKNEKIEEKKEEKPLVQELVKIAEEEGAPAKIPTPPPLKDFEKHNPTTFVEEEFSYEPELKKSSSKLVLRTRSLMNLSEEKKDVGGGHRVRPPAVRMKITTGRDGTFLVDGRKATSELNLSDESPENTPRQLRTSISGEELRKRKEEIFRPKEEPKKNAKTYYEEINQNNTRSTKEEAINNLKKYLQEKNIGLRELLTNNNVVIIDTITAKKPEDMADYNHKAVRDCRITGTLAKGEIHESNTLPRASKVHQPIVQRHYFYSLFKHRPSPPDEELPDPDKVRSTRQMFQKSKDKVNPMRIMMPIAAQISNPKKEVRPTPEVRVINQCSSPRRWTDSGSVSSGVSSDMSMLDNMSDKCYTSEEEVYEEEEPISPIIDTHPISPEVLKKIRECGTTITYYGGRVISHSHGPGNPMTMTIMNEIRKGRDGGRGKFRLVKSNSCGSRLELAGTEDLQQYHETSRNRFFTDLYGGTPLSEELRGSLKTVQEENKDERTPKETAIKKHNYKKNKNHNLKKFYQSMEKISEVTNDKKPSWRELIESRKQKREMEHNRRPCPDMVFEEFQVLET